MHRQRWRRASRSALVALVMAGALVVVPSPVVAVTPGCALITRPAAWPSGDPGTVFFCSYSEDGLTRTAYVYQPASWQPDTIAPAMVVLHGCLQQGPDMARLSRFDVQAEQHGFLVIYPNQAPATFTSPTTFDGNGSQCWNGPLPQAQQRGFGEPALIAGLTMQVRDRWHTDPARTYVIGASAGGAMSGVMAATYPDIFASTAVLAGCEYRGAPCFGSGSAIPPSLSGQWAYEASGGRGRVVPFLVEGGDADAAVPLTNSIQVTQQWQYTADYAADGGQLTNPVPTQPCAEKRFVPDAPVDFGQSPPVLVNPYTVYYYSESGAPCPGAVDSHADALGEFWIIHGESHAWPGGPASEPYSNPGGPDFTAVATDFFLAHPCRVAAAFCAPSWPPPDSIPPDTIIAESPPSASNATSAVVRFAGEDNSTDGSDLTFECALDGAAFASCTSPQSYSDLGVGSHNVAVRAVDEAGNLDPTPATASWRVEYRFDGFDAPVRNRPEVTNGTAGRSYTMRWRLSLDGAPVTDVGSVRTLGWTNACADASTAPLTSPPAKQGVQYDPTTKTFVAKWKTPSDAGCYAWAVDLRDGTRHWAVFQLQ